jgi:hypothetical protein
MTILSSNNFEVRLSLSVMLSVISVYSYSRCILFLFWQCRVITVHSLHHITLFFIAVISYEMYFFLSFFILFRIPLSKILFRMKYWAHAGSPWMGGIILIEDWIVYIYPCPVCNNCLKHHCQDTWSLAWGLKLPRQRSGGI